MSNRIPAKRRDLHGLPLREEPISDSALIEHLDGARVQTACARAGEVLAGAPLDDRDVDARQRQLARQHQPCRASSGDHHGVPGHRRDPPTAGAHARDLGAKCSQGHPERATRRQQHTHFVIPFPQILASAGDSAAQPGSCRKPPRRISRGPAAAAAEREVLHPLQQGAGSTIRLPATSNQGTAGPNVRRTSPVRGLGPNDVDLRGTRSPCAAIWMTDSNEGALQMMAVAPVPAAALTASAAS